MGCGISRFERNYDQGGDLSSGSSDYKIVQAAPQQQQLPLSVVEGEKDKESSTPEKKELEKIKVKRDVEESKEDGDDDKNNNDKHGHEERDDCFFNYPRSPSFREYCTDPEIRFGVDSSPDNNDGDDDMYTQETTKKISKSEMSSPKTQDEQPAVESGSKGENGASTEDKDEKSSSTVAAPASGLKIRNVLGYNKWGRGGSTRSIRSYFQVSNWSRPAIFNRSSPAEKNRMID